MAVKSPENLRVQGIVKSGLGHAAEFLSVEWVERELLEKAGLQPFPGTLNLQVPAQVWADLFSRRNEFLRIGDEAAGNCSGFLKPVLLHANGRTVPRAYVILPEKTAHRDILEIIAAENLREKLQLQDGDVVQIEELPAAMFPQRRP